MSMFIYFYQWFLPSNYYHLFLWTNDPLRRRRLGGWAGSLHECHLQKASENFENQGGDDDDDDDESGDEVGCTQKGYVRREVQNGKLGMVFSLKLQFYHSSVIFRMFTLHEKWLNRIPLRVPMISLAHVLSVIKIQHAIHCSNMFIQPLLRLS